MSHRRPKRKLLNVEIGFDDGSEEESQVEIGVIGSVSGSARLTHETHVVNKRSKNTTGTESEVEVAIASSPGSEEEEEASK